MRRGAVAAALLVLGGALAGCGSGDGGPTDADLAAADRVLAAVGQSPGELAAVDDGGTASGEGCERTIVVDEYGFEDEVVECPDGRGSGLPAVVDVAALSPDDPVDADRFLDANGVLPTWALDRLVAELPPSPLADGLADLAGRADRLDEVCGRDVGAWSDELAALADRAEELTALIEAGADGEAVPADLVGSTLVRATGRALFERVVLESGCAAPGATALSWDEARDRGLLDRTSRAALGVAELDRRLSGALSSRLFHFYSSLPNYEWLRTQRDGIDVVVLGTSQAGASIEVPVLADGLGAEVGNAFLPGSLAEVQQHWIPEVERYIDPGRVVWLLGAIDLLIDCDEVGPEAQFVERLEHRWATFGRSGWFRTIDPIEVILGPAGEVNLNRGNAAKKPAPDAAAMEAQRADYGPAFAQSRFCEDRAAVIAGMVAHLEAAGREVVIVGAPTSPLMAELEPDIEAETAAALTRLMDEYLAGTSATLVDLSGALRDPASWSDLTHPTQAGAEAFTTLVVEALQ